MNATLENNSQVSTSLDRILLIGCGTTQPVQYDLWDNRYIHVNTVDDEGMETLWYWWWRHQMETFSAILAIVTGNSPVTGEFPTQKPVTRSFDVFIDLRLNTRLSK